MHNNLGAVCDDFYVSGRLFLKMDIRPERETVLHFFDRLRKKYPGLRKLRRREGGGIIVEEDAEDGGSRRWVRVEANSLRFGQFGPAGLDEVREFGQLVLSQAPFHFTLGDLDYDHLELVFAFDLAYRGNHDQLVAETLLGENAASAFLFGEQAAHVIDAQPYYGIALTPECDLQAYVEVKSRTTTFEVRREAHEVVPMTVYLTVRKYWGVQPPAAPAEAIERLFEIGEQLASDAVVPNFVNPLAAAIASRS